MAGLRIRWRGVGRVAAIVALGLIAVRLVPGLLSTPEPPPLAADVGLPKGTVVTEEPATKKVAVASRPRHRRRAAKAVRESRPRVVPDGPASTAVMGTERRHRRAKKAPKPIAAPVESAPPLPAEPIVESPPEPSPDPAPVAPSAPPVVPADGSQEFAPR